MSTSREWSQRHIEELIRKNGSNKVGNHLTLVPGTPYINSFCVDRISSSNKDRWQGNISRALGNNYIIIRHSGCIEYPMIPINCRVPVKIANKVLTNDEAYDCSIIATSVSSYQYYYFVNIGGRDVDDDIFYHGGSIYDYLRPYLYMTLSFLTDEENTYLGYAPYYHSNKYTLTLHNSKDNSNVSLRLLRRFWYGDKEIDIRIPYNFRFRDNFRNAKIDYYINLAEYYDSLYYLYLTGLEQSHELVIVPNDIGVSIPSELNYLLRTNYIIRGPVQLIDTTKLPTNKQIPENTSIVGIKFYF